MAGVKPLLSSDWLSIDKTANQGSGKNPVTPDTDNPKAEGVPAGDYTLALVGTFDPAPASGEVLYTPDPYAFGSAWPSFTQASWTKDPADTPQGRVNQPDTYDARITHDGVAQVTINEYAGHDAHSQMTDDKGWRQNTPSGRSSTRWLLRATGRAYDALWPLQGAQPIPRRLAKGAVPNNNLSAHNINGALPNYADTVAGGPGNIAYSTPEPPQTTTPTPYAAPYQNYDYNGWGY